MLKKELKRVFIKNGFLYIALALIAFEIFSCIFGSYGIFENKSDREMYMNFANTYCGEATDEKKTELDKEFEIYNSANNMKEELLSELEIGNITQQEFDARFAEIREYLSAKNVFNGFYEECEYSFVDTQNRQIVCTKIWNKIFGDEKLDFFYIITIIICVLFSVIAEGESSFAEIKNTCKNGREKVYRIDVTICIAYALIMSLVISITRIMVLCSFTGNMTFSAPLESLPLFENTGYSISLMSGYILISALKMLGGAAFACLCIVLGRLLKSSLNILMFGLFVTIIPPYIFSSPTLYYISPVSLLISNGFFFGDVIFTGDDVGGTIINSVSVSPAALVFSCIFAVCVIASAYILRIRRSK